jgi:cbb3-type cytochrome oxidase subunit 3
MHIIEVPIESNKGGSSRMIIGAAVGCSLLLLLLVLAGVHAFRQKKRAERAIELNNPFGKMDTILELATCS